MSTAITGTVTDTIDVFGSFSVYIGVGCVNSAETYGYYGSRTFSTGGILRLQLSNFTGSWLYPTGFFGGAISLVFLSADELTLYALLSTGALWSAATDGSSGSPTSVMSLDAPVGTPSVHYLASAGRYYYSDNTSRGINYIDIGNAMLLEWKNPGSVYHNGVGPCRYAANSILLGSSNNGIGYVKQYSRTTGHAVVLCGNGETDTLGASGTSAYLYASKKTTSIDSDADGRIYFVDNGSVRMLDSGTVTAPGTLSSGSLSYLPTANRLILESGDTLRRAS